MKAHSFLSHQTSHSGGFQMSPGQLQVGVGWIPVLPYLEHKLKRIQTHL